MDADITIEATVIARLPEIGPDGLALYVFLKHRAGHKGQCWPGYDDISSGTGLNRHRIATAAKALEAAGMIERRRRFSSSTVYVISALSALMDQQPPAISADTALMDAPISAEMELMDTLISADTALIEPAISPVIALMDAPLVQNRHSNLRELNLKYERGETMDEKTQNTEPEPFGQMIERLLGCTIGAGDVQALADMQKAGVTEADIRAAIAWRISNNVAPARRAADILKGALHEKRQRVQRGNAKAAPATPRKKPAMLPMRHDTAASEHQRMMSMPPEERARWEAAEMARAEAALAARGIV